MYSREACSKSPQNISFGMMCTDQLLHIADVCVYKISTENVNFVVLCSARVNVRLLMNYVKS